MLNITKSELTDLSLDNQQPSITTKISTINNIYDSIVLEILKMNKYSVIKVIGVGSSEGKAILVRKIENEQMFVIKQRNFTDIEEANDGLNEAMLLAKLQNSNIVKFEEVFIVNNGNNGFSLCIVMEYCDGGDLFEFMINLILAGGSASHGNEIEDTLELEEIEESEEEEYTISSTSPSSSTTSSTSSCTTTSTTSNISSYSYCSTPESFPTSFKDMPKINLSPQQSTLTHSGIYEQQKAYQLLLYQDRKLDEKTDTQKKKSSSWYRRKSKDQKDFSISNTEQPFLPPLSPTINYGNKKTRILIPPKVLYNWIYQLCLGVHQIHNSHFIHRDLKSENIFLSQCQIKIGDFGLATKFESSVKGVAGTYYYSSPEILNNQPYCRPADIFSLGCIIYEMTTLHLLPLTKRCIAEELISGTFDAASFKKEFPTDYHDLADLVLKMLDENAEYRPSIDLILQHKIFDVFKIPKSFEKVEVSATSVSNVSTFSISPHGGFRKQLEKADLVASSALLAEAYDNDPRFSWIGKKDKPKSHSLRKMFFYNGLKIMFEERFLLWGYHNSDNVLNGVACWMTPDYNNEDD
ncbi:putative protein serine/threonine kinase [Heterostelium album PN500]|uniref:non-specific serine/threonine protein kinase n=1 Tax=Heterostelium pallidum (strain ATCC 26659 / Pp 5 / PN500) TaxID=670386 RepID=D3BT30_HETP5|nr:putative protein serine/threonine kinase [Heterostelium album PN500]EFA75247.1 putative protein serine/threonine kinase [Heterostelium album PN500]|eukprot:XP_020427381.1 putative protein serine/threonine kinase [Heterostelium album PN500]